ncbi:hypothetical protein AKJ50_02395 [candidate division MSBL1 archaeon SCGC-AAA382A13]|uniref:Exosome protein n=1 Tax=candidate division MSBL1 archaeon SCGC-AAA382A13 TaxID=1698279 RepID=A0A133VDB9_9EURY|nr:hypothetical protein AKJ50_02395 [candidate division MSBL1 archaeon SCGC-AAA382A13]PTD94426.1 hypothetical protein C9439_02600 [archaeon SCG-AAA382B04]
MSQAPVHYIRLRTFCYSTEKLKRVKKALSFFLPKDNEIETEEIEGNFGNKYFLLKSKIEKSREIRLLVDFLKNNLTTTRYREIKKEIPDRINEECSFYLRFDKQKAYKKQLEPTSSGDFVVLRFKVKAYPAKKKNAINKIKQFL